MVGVDISKTMIKFTKKRFTKRLIKNTELYVVDGEHLPFLTDEFDIAYTCGMFIHVSTEYIKNYIQEVMRVCRIGCFGESQCQNNKKEYYFCHDYATILDELGFSFKILSGELQIPSKSCYFSVTK